MSRRPSPRRNEVLEELPPHDGAIEQAAVGSILAASLEGSQAQVDEIIGGLSMALFYTGQPRIAFDACRAIRAAGHALDQVTLGAWWKKQKLGTLEDLQLVLKWSDEVPSSMNWTTYRDQLLDLRRRREILRLAKHATQVIKDPKIDPHAMRREFAEILDDVASTDKAGRKVLEIMNIVRHSETQLRDDLCLVGNNDISKGYEGIMVIGGPPGSGKSLVAVSLAIAGAIGKGYWMGRKIHRKFRTMIIQAENGSVRLQAEFRAMLENHPDLKDELERCVRVSKPPEGGLPFHQAEFRRELAKAVAEFKPDVIVLDPWTAVAADDSSKDIVDKLAEIRSCLPPGDECPALVIVAHTRKPRPEHGQQRGRSLMYSVSGSQALVATARCVYVLFPFTDDIQDDRVLWACAKLSNGEAGPDTVWHRRLGTFFKHCDDDPELFWKPKKEEPEQWLTPEMVKALLEGSAMTVNRLATAAAEKHNAGRGASTVHKWLKEPAFASHLHKQAGLVSWKD